jgi:ferrous iron transport protein A
MSFTNLTQMGEHNQLAEIVGFLDDSMVVARLQELGLHHGLQLTWVGRAPFKGPMLFQFGGTVLALREEEAACVLVKKI